MSQAAAIPEGFERGLRSPEALAFFAEIRCPADPLRKDEAHRLKLGRTSLVLRRDCHGALRKLEARFPGADRASVRARLAELATWQVVLPGQLELADVPALGKLYLLADQLNAALRLEPSQGLLQDLVQATVTPSEGENA